MSMLGVSRITVKRVATYRRRFESGASCLLDQNHEVIPCNNCLWFSAAHPRFMAKVSKATTRVCPITYPISKRCEEYLCGKCAKNQIEFVEKAIKRAIKSL